MWQAEQRKPSGTPHYTHFDCAFIAAGREPSGFAAGTHQTACAVPLTKFAALNLGHVANIQTRSLIDLLAILLESTVSIDYQRNRQR